MSNSKHFFHRLKSSILYRLAKNDFYKRVVEINRNEKIINVEGSQFHIKALNLTFDVKNHGFIVNNFEHFMQLINSNEFSFKIREESIICTINGIDLTVNNDEEVFILNEIWIQGVYNFTLNSIKETIVIDVGMNVAFTSLFFARRASIAKVYAFEPFIPTYEQGLRNIDLNPKLKDKINTANYGLYAEIEEKEFEVNYSEEYKGQMGIQGTDNVRGIIKESRIESICLKNFNSLISKIETNHTNADFIWKIDCEGAEYEIIENLDAKLTENVRIIMLEWHNKGPETIDSKLRSLGYSTIVHGNESYKAGMIYAFK